MQLPRSPESGLENRSIPLAASGSVGVTLGCFWLATHASQSL